ncbi:MAG TPA: hypothetical protein PLS41_06710, partial [Bacteroidales bacterium]|nr:hypothetical protein [Bacteroidales bacterium]
PLMLINFPLPSIVSNVGLPVRYEPVKNLYTGMGFTYIFYRNNYYSPAWTTHIFGGSLYIRYLLFQKILLQGEYQWLNYDGLDDFTLENIRKTVPGYLAGIGYRQWFSAKKYGDFFLLWNFNATADYPISNPSVRITIGGFFR